VVSQRYSGRAFCGRHLVEDVEAKACREIRAGGGIRPGDRMAIAFSAASESIVLARFLLRIFGKRRDLSFSALGPDGGDRMCSSQATLEAVARSLGLEWIPFPRGDAGAAPPGGTTRDRRGDPQEATALRAGATVLVRGDCLDDLAGHVLGRVMEGEVPAGNRQTALRTLTPFRRIPREEIRLYAGEIGVRWDDAPFGAAGNEREDLAAALLADHAARHPSAPHALLRLWDSLEGREEGILRRET
jgi:tRNA(Ile)-lysidine synthase TilS/MesJ